MKATEPKSLYLQLKSSILEKILNGEFRPDSAIPSENELMRIHHLSSTTVRRAIHELVRDGVIYRKQGRGTFVAARTTRNFLTRTNKIGVILYDMSFLGQPYSSRFLGGISEVLNLHGYNLAVYAAKDSISFRNSVLSERIDGLILNNRLTDFIRLANENRTPLVLTGNDIGEIPGVSCSQAVMDGKKSLRLVFEHLWSLGHRDILVLEGKVWEIPLEKDFVYDVYRNMCAERGIPFQELFFQRGNYGYEGGYCLMKRFLDIVGRPSAVFATEDMMATGAIKAIAEAHLKVPDDVAVIGAGDYLLDSTLTTIAEPIRKMGETAAELLIESLHVLYAGDFKPRKVVLEPHLVVRESCGYRKKELESLVPNKGGAS